MSGWAALGAAADSALGGAIGAYRDKKNVKYQKELMDYQNQLDIQNWNMVNEYNKPANQMARYAEAGLNPNLIYGQSNTAGSIAAPSGKFDSSIPDINPVAAFLSYKNMSAETKNKEKQNSLLQSQADFVKEQTHGQALENALKKKTLESIGSGNPNDPYWYRDLKKAAQPVADVVGRFVGNAVGGVTSAQPYWTVRYNGKEYTASTDAEAVRLLNLAKQADEVKKGRWYERKDRGGR